MGELKEQAIQFFENEIYHYRIMLNGVMNKEYRQYIEKLVQYYSLAIETLKEGYTK